MATMLGRSATPDAYTRTLRARCPLCHARLVHDDFGVWCSDCLWCGTCEGRGCGQCPQRDEYKAMVDTMPPTPTRVCETCRQGPRVGQFPQCARCMRLRIPPADVVPLVGATAEVVREKRVKWLRVHPGWGLSPNRDYVMRAPGTKDQPFGKQLLVVEYRVERGFTAII